MYNKKVMEIFQNPQNVGEIKGASGIGTSIDEQCGDIIKLYLQIYKNIVTDAKFKAFGCAGTIACGSVITELVLNKTVEEISKITSDEILKAVGGLPEQKVFSSIVAKVAIDKAILDYNKKQLKLLKSKNKKNTKKN